MSRQNELKRLSIEKVEKLFKAIADIGNPFQDDSGNLVSLDTKDVTYPNAVELVIMYYEKVMPGSKSS